MSGIGSHKAESYQKLQDALQDHAREVYGEQYLLQDFVMLGFVVSMTPGDEDKYEYIMATSSYAPHVIDGMVDQVKLFRENDSDANDDDDD